MAIDLYLMDMSPPCRAVDLTAKYLGIDVNKKHVDLLKKEHLTPEFLKMNPLHTVPTLDDDGFYLWESRAIMGYLVSKYAPESDLYPKDPKRRAVVDKLLYFDIGTFYKAISASVKAILVKGEEWDAEKEETIKKQMHSLDEFLKETPYVAGDKLTIADLSFVASVENLKVFAEELIKLDFSDFPRIVAWIKRIEEELPYYREVSLPGVLQLKAFLKIVEEEKKKKEASS